MTKGGVMDAKNRNIIKFLCIAGVTLTFVLISVLLYQFIRIGNQNKEKERLDSHLMEITEQTENYSALVEDMSDMDFLEDYARESGWAQNGDIKFN